jgi:hypothetical protein
MTEQPGTSRPGMWDSVFSLVFGRRGAPAPRPQTAPAPLPTQAQTPLPPPMPAPPMPPPAAATQEPEPAPPPAVAAQEPVEPEPAPPPAVAAQEPVEPEPAPPLDPAAPATPIVAPIAITPFAQKLVDFCHNEWDFFRKGALRETEDPAITRIASYWSHVGKDGWDGNTPEPWSAAFISFAMKEAGDNGRFKKATGHCIYINDAIKRCNDPEAPFHGKRLEEYAPQLGDLIARTRAGSDVTFDTAPNTPWYTSHTDIVTAIKPGEVEMTGGNVSNSVYVRRLPLLPDGRLEPTAAAANGVFAIMKNNL